MKIGEFIKYIIYVPNFNLCSRYVSMYEWMKSARHCSMTGKLIWHMKWDFVIP